MMTMCLVSCQAKREREDGETQRVVMVWKKLPLSCCCFLVVVVRGCPYWRNFDRELVPVVAEHQPLKQLKKELGCRLGKKEKGRAKSQSILKKFHSLQVQL